MNKRHQAARSALMAKALSYPGAWEDHPWGESVVKVGKKLFFTFGREEDGLSCTMKLEHTSEAALTTFPWCAPTGYGLGKSGWVTARFEPKQDVPVPLLMEWMEESYRAVAPKRGLPPPGSPLPAKAPKPKAKTAKPKAKAKQAEPKQTARPKQAARQTTSPKAKRRER